MKAIRRLHVRTVLPQTLAPLHDLALNLRWSWHPPTRDLFESIDPELWAATGKDPIAVLSALRSSDMDRLAADQSFVAEVKDAAVDLERYLSKPRWYQENGAGRVDDDGETLDAIAYFSPEFGITAVLPQYSGGLGILAGDHLKAASDQGIPIVGVGLFYKSGYFAQRFNADGWQQESYPVLDPDDLPLSLLREEDGTPVVIRLTMPRGAHLDALVWRAQVGRVPLLLLDSDIETNDPVRREVTNRLYGGGGDQRLEQEMLLGIGGVRALRAYSRITGAPKPSVYHTNEGHAGFQGVERISELVDGEAGLDFDQALQAVRAATVFTTHTPVPAGIDRFDVQAIASHFGEPCALPGVSLDQLLALGAEGYPGGDHRIFNMAVMGMRLGQRVNGVSQLHGAVSREMFKGLWPGFDLDEVPIGSITNGVHAGTWVDRRLYDLAKEHLGNDVAARSVFTRIHEVPIDAFWATKRELREQLITDTRARLKASMVARGSTEAELGWTDSVLDPDTLTIGFARRGATYKRLTLMLQDPERLKKLLTDPERPVQIIIAGKSHPADDTGKALIQDMVRFGDDPEVRGKIIYLPNYDIAMAQQLYPGCDVWLNNPLRPFEACGTSGMKAALNGALNLSILDGWWDEWYDGQNGWAIPTADGVEDPERRDQLEASALYELLENTVVPTYYDRDESGLPQRWLDMVSHTLSTLGPKVLADRMVRDYTEQYYWPAAHAAWAVTHADFAGAKDLAAFVGQVHENWPHVHIDHVEASGLSDAPQIGDEVTVHAYVTLGDLDPSAVKVQMALGRANAEDTLTDVDFVDLGHDESFEEGSRHRFEGTIKLKRTGALGWTVRVLPRHEYMSADAELGLVTLP
ncbi:MAG: alpha-glucan family phosphorylase [Ornithinimicrobium sp.]|uniref:alpha-glucan family phosphorylase n=1 Tax=Ornithinimicrobium sp. TaxID=1977084 RepID=UPI0026E021A1|nr:alpha-glucan family phosphorylase [Ornithinimicrobium sp.]MDO5740242.1 alpha-glucan family phosphorylase [Ornithinimicrobium sp.]